MHVFAAFAGGAIGGRSVRVRRSRSAPGEFIHFSLSHPARPMQCDATRCISDRSHTVFSSHKNAASYVMKASSTRSQCPLKQQARRPRLLQKRKDILGVALVERAAKGSNSCLPRKPQARAKYRGSLGVKVSVGLVALRPQRRVTSDDSSSLAILSLLILQLSSGVFFMTPLAGGGTPAGAPAPGH